MTIADFMRLGNECLEREEPRAAIPYFTKILQAAPNHALALAGLAKATLQLNDPQTAWQMAQMSLSLAPGEPDVLNAAGSICLALGDASAAIGLFKGALERAPDEPGVQVNLAAAYSASADLAAAEDIYLRLETSGKADVTARYNHSLVQLLQGRFAEAWPGFELRGKALNTGLGARDLPGRLWDGSVQPDSSLLIHAEQGLGDNIQFARFVPEIARRVGRVVLEAPGPLLDLFESLSGPSSLVAFGDKLPPCDLHVSVMSLPALCGVTEETIPNATPYLSVAEETVAAWSERLGKSDGRLHIGVVWAGNAGHRRDRERSVHLSTLAPVFQASENVAWHALQIGEPLLQIESVPEAAGMDVLFPEPKPMTDVAAALTALDLLISVDTGLAHLAGALARPVWTLITYLPDWRWMMKRTDSPWYPTMRLFRQPAQGDWDATALDVAKALGDLEKN